MNVYSYIMIGSRVSLRTYFFEFQAWKNIENLKIYVPLVFTRSRVVRITSLKKKKKGKQTHEPELA